MNALERLSSVLSQGTKTFAVTDVPPVFERGKGATLFDEAGRPFIDMASGSSVMHVGYGNRVVLDAVRAQLDTGIAHIGPHFHTLSQVRFLDRLAGVLPPALQRIHPATNGAEATEVALKLCQYATGRRRFATFEGSYHGRTAGALAVSAARGKSGVLGPFLPEAQVLPYPCCTCGTADPDACGRCRVAITAALDALQAAASIDGGLAGIFVEPVQGTGGMRVPPKGFLTALSEAAKSLGAPLVFDEVFTAFGRTGRLFAFEHEGVVPDVLVLAKSLGGGLPAGVVATTERIMTCVPAGAISSTFQLHPMSAAAAEAALAFTLSERLPDRARTIERWFESALGDLRGRSPVRAISGLGAMFGLEIVDGAGRPDPQACRRIRRRCLERGLITYECGLEGEVLGLLPPLVITREEFDTGMRVLVDELCIQTRETDG